MRLLRIDATYNLSFPAQHFGRPIATSLPYPHPPPRPHPPSGNKTNLLAGFLAACSGALALAGAIGGWGPNSDVVNGVSSCVALPPRTPSRKCPTPSAMVGSCPLPPPAANPPFHHPLLAPRYVSLFAVCTNTNGSVNCVLSNLSQSAVAGGVLLLIGSFFGFLDFICVLLKSLFSCCNQKRDAHARFFLVFLSFVAIFVGTVVGGGADTNGKTYVEALKAAIKSTNPLGGGFGCAIMATITSFFALLLSLVADCLEKKEAAAPELPK